MKQIAALEVDIGVSKLHVGAVSLADGTSIAESETPYQWDVLADGRGEINPDKIWNVAQDALEGVLHQLDMDRVEIKALSFSCFGDCFVGVDEAGDPVYPMLLFSDQRAMGLEDEIPSQVHGRSYARITGGPLTGAYVFAKMYWMKKNVPQIYEKVDAFYNIQQFMLRRMGLPPVTDYGMAARKMMFDVEKLEWAPELCGILEKNPSCFGETAEAATVVGRIRRFGRVELPCEVAVVLGAHDAQCGYLGLGVKPDNRDNVIANNAGTYNLFGTLSRNRLVLDSPIITPGCGPVRGSYHFQAGEMIGPTMDWFTRKIAHSDLSTLFGKARFDASCRVRMTRDPINGDGAFEGISVLHDEIDLFTGMIESFTLPMKGWYEAMKSTAREGRFSTMRIGAGGAKSDAWIQLKANILGIPVEKVQNLQSSSVGLAMIYAVAMGECADYGEACDRMVRVARVYEPDMKLYERYCERTDE